MPMNFIQVINDAVALLQANENGQYRALGYQVLSDTPDEAFIEGDDTFLGTVRIFHKASDFPAKSGSRNGPVNNEVKIALEFKTAAKAKGDMTVLSDESALPADVITALAAVQNAELIANGKMDNLFSTVYNIIMDLRNKKLGSSINIGSRWISQYAKDDPVRFGAIVALTAGATITALVPEQLSGAPTPAQPTEKTYDTDTVSTYDDTGADVTNAGVKVTN